MELYYDKKIQEKTMYILQEMFCVNFQVFQEHQNVYIQEKNLLVEKEKQKFDNEKV